jgi:hypothetical protein
MRRPSGPYGEIDRDEWNVVNFVNDGGELISVGMRKGSGGGRLRRLRTTARLRHVHLMLTTRTKRSYVSRGAKMIKVDRWWCSVKQTSKLPSLLL